MAIRNSIFRASMVICFFMAALFFFVLRISPKKTSIPNFCITIEGTIQIFSRRDVGGRRPPKRIGLADKRGTDLCLNVVTDQRDRLCGIYFLYSRAAKGPSHKRTSLEASRGTRRPHIRPPKAPAAANFPQNIGKGQTSQGGAFANIPAQDET